MNNLSLHIATRDDIFLNKSTAGRVEYISGTKYQVYPCIFLVEGVHHGVGTSPVYYPPSVLKESAPLWNNMPVTLGHPALSDGTHVLCNHDGTIRAAWQVGHLTKVTHDGNKLRGEVWLDYNSTAFKNPHLLQFIENGGNLEVSTGLSGKMDGIEGVWNAEHYSSSVVEIIPDHLALLPSSKGACSWEDGCGVRFNESAKLVEILNELKDEATKEVRKMADKKGCCEEKVNSLILSEFNGFTESDREWLLTLNEEQFSKIEPLIEAPEVVEKIVEKEVKISDDITLEAFVSMAPAPLQEIINTAIKAIDDSRAEVIKSILNHKDNKLTEIQLTAMDDSTLEAISSFIRTSPSKNFSGQRGASPVHNVENPEPYVTPTLSSIFNKK